MTFDPHEEILDFDFTGVEPATFGDFRALPKGEYNVQCTGVSKYFTGQSKGEPNPNKPNLLFEFVVINHPEFTGKEFKGFKGLSHSLHPDSKPFLLNTLQALMPLENWQQGIKMTLAALIYKATGQPCNAYITWAVNTGSGENANKRYVNNDIKSLKPYDATIKQPVASEGNPPIINNEEPSAVQQQAAAGVPKEEVDSFLSSIPSGESAGTPATPAMGGFEFGDEPF